MKFVKMQATGNDFILIDGRYIERDLPWLAQPICNRHFGVGSDGLLLLLSSEVADFRMRMFNPDGSEAEACGNGLRCFGKYVVDYGISTSHELKVETMAGIRTIWPMVVEGKVVSVQVSMGVPKLKPSDIPVLVERSTLDITSVMDYFVIFNGWPLLLSFISMGNPHAICFLEHLVDEFPLAELGPMVERHEIFPQRTNFGVANILNRHHIKARIWERGAGETLSCGSGACACAVAAQFLDYADSPLDITLPGGTLTIDWDGVGEVLLNGQVDLVFSGEWI